MKKIPFYGFLIAATVWVQTAQALQAKFDLQQFFAPATGSYIEVQIRILANSVAFAPVNNDKNALRASVEITLQIVRKDTIIKFDKWRLNSPLYDSLFLENFQDLQRYALDTGSYKLLLFIKDVNAPKNDLNFEYKFSIKNQETAYISGITLCGSPKKTTNNNSIYTKSSYEIYPRLQQLYAQPSDTLHFYTEAYYINDCTINYYIIDADDGKEITKKTIKNKEFAAVRPLLLWINLADVRTGNYILKIVIRDSLRNNIVGQAINFQRINDKIILSTDFLSQEYTIGFASKYTLPEMVKNLKSLSPIVLPREHIYIENTLRSKDLATMQRFFRWFWEQRSPLQPAQAWAVYDLELQKVQNSFGNKFMKGYATERGRVYLKYGAPNTRNTIENDPQAYPYEIWQYNKLGTQNNVRFVFYNPSLATSEYILLHSEAIGETKFDNWRNEIYSRNSTGQRNIGKENGSKDLKNGRLEDMYRNN